MFDLIMDILHAIFGNNAPPTYHKKLAILNGSVLFADEYSNNTQFFQINQLFSKKEPNPIIRVPFNSKTSQSKLSFAIDSATKNNLSVIVLLDEFCSDKTMENRISYVAQKHSNVKYFELFNELPWMKYAGEQLTGLDQLISKTNQYSSLVKRLIPGAKTISMAPANSLQEMEYDNVWGGNNDVQTERLIKETNTDIAGLHCYVDSSKQRYNFRKFMRNLEKWNQDKKKKIWITETGTSDWDKHVSFYEEWTSRFYEYLNAEKVIWYRQTIKSKDNQDSGFALEYRDGGERSPLWDELVS